MAKKVPGQISIFENEENTRQSMPSKKTVRTVVHAQWKLYVDGASRGNPGKAGVGIVIKKGETVVACHGFYIGHHTNNEAEYVALLVGLYFVKKQIDTHESLTIYSDSELLVKQCTGVYRVKKAELKCLYDGVMNQLESMRYTIKHLLREYNTQADAAANEGIDTKKKMPLTLLDKVHRCGFEL